ncbi:putative lipoprotein [Roseibium sp. TrichSKD4]|nr:putative lipoprotein [Roseibium sp. TrichSKD4]
MEKRIGHKTLLKSDEETSGATLASSSACFQKRLAKCR